MLPFHFIITLLCNFDQHYEHKVCIKVNFSKLAAQINEQYKSFYIQTSHPPTYTCPRCVSEKGSGPHFKHYRCRKREKIPLLL